MGVVGLAVYAELPDLNSRPLSATATIAVVVLATRVAPVAELAATLITVG